MFFALSKILLFLLMPLTWVFLLVLLAFVLKRGKWKKKLLVAAGLTLFIFSNTFIVDEFQRGWEVPAIQDKDLAPHNLAIVLGGMSGWDARFHRIQFYSSSDRLWQAVRLYKEGKVKKILVSGGSGMLNYQQYKESDFIREYLQTLGVHNGDFYYENQSRNTHENAVYSKKVIETEKLSGPVLLITSGFHLRRAAKCFDKAGIPSTLYATDRATGDRRFSAELMLIPNAEALLKWNGLIKEWMGLVMYKVQGYC
jgi:uncharacterized SAM-binding protein YcdF (DUF218 family)